MLKTIRKLAVLVMMVVSSTSGAEDVGFLNVINGSGLSVRLLLDNKVVFEAMEPGSMSGGLSVKAGSAKLAAESEGVKDDSTPVTVTKDQSQLVIIGAFKNKENPPKDVLRIESVPYRIKGSEGFSVGLIYAGIKDQIAVTAGGREIVLKRYEYTDIGSVSRNFSFKDEIGASYQADFYDPMHYTLVVLDGGQLGKVRVLVVPNVTYQKPTF